MTDSNKTNNTTMPLQIYNNINEQPMSTYVHLNKKNNNKTIHVLQFRQDIQDLHNNMHECMHIEI